MYTWVTSLWLYCTSMKKKTYNSRYHIAFCTCCMNRCHQLEETLLQNIKDNDDYDLLEFVLLDYNSSDHLEEWTKCNLKKYIDSGRLKYFKTFEPTFFHHGHAKNLVFKLTNAEIVCNINSDHFTGRGFATFIGEAFKKNDRIVVTPIPNDIHNKTSQTPPGELWGKVCVRKSDFLAIGGYDERMIKFGNDDVDFINRLVANNVQCFHLTDDKFEKFISHNNDTRYSSKNRLNKLSRVLVEYKDPSSSNLLFLFEDMHFENFTIIDNDAVDATDYLYSFRSRIFNHRYKIKDLAWSMGSFLEEGNRIILYYETGESVSLKKNATEEASVTDDSNEKKNYYVLADLETLEAVSTLNYVYYNLTIMLKNSEEKIIDVNEGCFGRSKVFENFNYQVPIEIQ